MELLPLILLAACSESKSEPGSGTPDGGDASDADTDADSDTDTDADTDAEPVGDIPAIRIEGEATWTLSFDEEAEAGGYEDCTYARTYEGVQFLDMDYLCPDCDAIARGTATMTEGADCYSTVFGEAESERTELWGFSSTGTFYRSSYDQVALGELTTFTPPAAEGEAVDLAWEGEYTLESGGALVLAASGTMTWWTDPETLLADPWVALAEPSSCGWERNDPGDLTLDYDLAVGAAFPNVRLDDQCGDPVDLWDFYGSYLVLDASVYDCGPCQLMAQESGAFLDEMAEDGIPVRAITFLGNGLSEPWGTVSEDIMDEWVTSFDVGDPVLYDRGFTWALFPAFAEEAIGEDYGFPTWIVVDPEMNVITGNVGYSSWDAMEEIVRADYEGR